MKKEWLIPGGIVPVDMETTAALVTEIKRLRTEQPAQEPVAWLRDPKHYPPEDKILPHVTWKQERLNTIPLYTTPQPQEPRNFCPRCGKRTADLTVIHTCTPPRGLEMT